MILDHVADRAGLVVKLASSLDPEVLRHRDLNALDVVTIPDRFQERIGEAKEQHVVHLLLAEVVVDSVDRLLVKRVVQNLVQRLCGREDRGQKVSRRRPDCPSHNRTRPVAPPPLRIAPAGSPGNGPVAGHP